MQHRFSDVGQEETDNIEPSSFVAETIDLAEPDSLRAVRPEDRQDWTPGESAELGAGREQQRAPEILGDYGGTPSASGISVAPVRSDYPISRVLEYRMQQLPPDLLVIRQKALVWANQMKWGRRGQTLRALTGALVVRMSLDKNERFRASFRESADISQRSRSVIQEAIRDLRAWEFIVWRGTTRHHAHIWQFGPAVYDIELPSYASRIVNPCELFTDAAEAGALGMDGVRVWQTLWRNGPLRTQELSLLCGLDMGQTGRLLRLLKNRVEGFPLVERQSDGRWAARGPDDPTMRPGQWLDEHVARPLGYLGARKRRIARHDHERALYGIR